MDSGKVSMALAFCMLLSTQFNLAIVWLASTEFEMISVERVRQYFTNDTENLKFKPSDNLKTDSCAYKRKNDLSEEHSIVFQGVSLSYQKEESLSNHEETIFALRNISFNIKKGEKVAICGRYCT